MKDLLLHAIAGDGQIICIACISTRLVDEARRRHGLYPIPAAALGRLMTGGLMLAAFLKGREKLVIGIKATGPIKGLTVEARPDGSVRGFVANPQVDLPSTNGKLSVGKALGGGFLYVTRFLEEMGKPYQGVVELVSGEISEDLTYYLAQSEQIPSAISLGVFVEPDNQVAAAGGVMVQAMPGGKEKDLSDLERNMAGLSGISSCIKGGMPVEELVAVAMQGIPYRVLETRDIGFACRCAEVDVEQAVSLMHLEDLAEMLAENERGITCKFCGRSFELSRECLERLVQERLGKEGSGG